MPPKIRWAQKLKKFLNLIQVRLRVANIENTRRRNRHLRHHRLLRRNERKLPRAHRQPQRPRANQSAKEELRPPYPSPKKVHPRLRHKRLLKEKRVGPTGAFLRPTYPDRQLIRLTDATSSMPGSR